MPQLWKNKQMKRKKERVAHVRRDIQVLLLLHVYYVSIYRDAVKRVIIIFGLLWLDIEFVILYVSLDDHVEKQDIYLLPLLPFHIVSYMLIGSDSSSLFPELDVVLIGSIELGHSIPKYINNGSICDICGKWKDMFIKSFLLHPILLEYIKSTQFVVFINERDIILVI
ncbi:hypothetical protein ACJX0J_031117, partial [Zea mays]